jgi:hypothetical protein
MSTLEIERIVKNTVQATEAVEVIDCGRASERTQGVTFMILFELGAPPHNKLFLL